MTDPFFIPEGPSQIGVLDIGSNSIRFVVYDVSGSHFTPVYNEKVLAGLGRGLKETNRLSEEGKRVALDVLARFKTIADMRALDRLMIAATAAMREAEDAPDFIAEIKARTGLSVTPISGEEEGRLSALGLLAGDPDAQGLAADLGGASLELVQIADRMPGERVSLPLGPFDAVGADLRGADYPTLRPLIDAVLGDQPKALLQTDKLYLIGGAWRNLANIHMARTNYPLRTLQAFSMDAAEARDLARWAYMDGREALFDWPGLRVQRAETLPWSGLLLDALLDHTQASQVVLSLTGLREGLVFDCLPPEVQARDALLDGCRDFATGLLQSEYFGAPLIDFVEAMAADLPPAFGQPMDSRLRKASSLLAGLGKNLHPDYRAELVFEDVLYAPIAGLDHAERVWLAMSLFRSVSYGKKPPNHAAVERLLSPDQQSAAAALGALIRLAIVATGRTPELVPSIQVTRVGDVLEMVSARPELLTEQVSFRLGRLADLLGLDYRFSSLS